MSDIRNPDSLVMSPAPHFGVRTSSAAMAWMVTVSLLPATAWGALLFGIPALLVLAVAVGTSLAAEALSSLLMRRFTLHDGSAFLTGLLIALFMPSGVPLYVPAAAAAFAILVVKQSFGGLGRNWMNPAMGGTLFALISWDAAIAAGGQAMGLLGEVTTPSPLQALRAAATAGGATPLAVLAGAGYRFSSLDAEIVGWINSRLLSFLGTSLQPGTFDVFVGYVSGSIGTVSTPLLLLGAAFLIRRRIVRWQVSVAYIAVFMMLTLAFGGLVSGGWTGGVGFHLFSGSLIIGTFFVAVDPVTSPLTVAGRLIYGILLGVLTFFMRFFGSLGDGVVVSIVLGNSIVPLIDRRLRHRSAAPAAPMAPGSPGCAPGDGR